MESSKMFKQLRARFIVMTMISVLGVLVIIMTAINLLNYRKIIQDSDKILSVLAENKGRFPDGGDEGIPPEFPDGLRVEGRAASESEGTSDAGSESSQDKTGNTQKWMKDRGKRDSGFFRQRGMSEETPFESRYFCVSFDESGSVTSTDTQNIAAVDDDQAVEYAKTALKKSSKARAKGMVGQYRFLRVSEGETTSIIFLDCSRSLANVHSFLLATILVSLVGLAAVMLLVILFSGRIMHPIQESYEKQKRFITDAGHELKTPLTVINADLSVLEMDVGESEWIDDARLQTERLTKLTNDLVYLSKMDEAQRRVEMIDFPLSDVVSEVSQSFRSRAIVEGKTFESIIAPMISYRGDEKAIRELVSILLDNALKYSPAGGLIRISLALRGKAIELQVRNTAEEISQESISHLFDRFYRTDQSRSSETGGFGLGLAIARAVVSAHKGKITASSDDGRSLCITVLL